MLTISGPVVITTQVHTLAQLRGFLELCELTQLDFDAPLRVQTRLGVPGWLDKVTVKSNTVAPAHASPPETRYSPVASRP